VQDGIPAVRWAEASLALYMHIYIRLLVAMVEKFAMIIDKICVLMSWLPTPTREAPRAVAVAR